MATTTVRGISSYLYTGDNTGINHTGWTAFAITGNGRTSGFRSINAYLTGIIIQVKDIAGSAAKLTIGLTSDSAGEKPLIPDTVSDITVGKASATKGGSILQVDIGIRVSIEPFYVWLKTDAGTCTVTNVTATVG